MTKVKVSDRACESEKDSQGKNRFDQDGSVLHLSDAMGISFNLPRISSSCRSLLVCGRGRDMEAVERGIVEN